MATTAAVLQIAVKAETARARAELAATDAHVKKSAKTADTATRKMNKSFASTGDSADDLRERFVAARGDLERLRKSSDKGVLHQARLRAANKDVRRLSDSVVGLERDQTSLTRSTREVGQSQRSLIGRIGRTNTAFTFLRNNIRLIKWPALIAGLTLAAAAAVSLTSALGPTVGLLGALPGLVIAGAASMGALKLAFKGVGSALGGLNEELDRSSDEFKNLSPEGQRFVEFLETTKPRIRELQRTAQKGLFPGVQQGIERALQNFPVFNRVVGRAAEMLGGLAKRAGDLAGRKAFGSDLEKVANANTKAFDRFGRGGIRIISALRHVAVVARPLTKWLSKLALGWAKNADDAAEAGRKSGKMAEFFDKARNRAELLGRILGNVTKTLFGVGNASENTGKTMLQEFERTTAGWAKWTNSIEGQNELKEWFADAKQVMDDIWAGIGRVIDRFQQLRAEGKTTGAALGIMLVEGIEKAIPVIADHAGRLGLIAIREFAKAWWNSDIAGKLLLTTIAGMKLGLFAGLGQKAAGKFLGHFVKQKAATEGGASMAGSLIGGFRTRLGGARDKIKDILKRAFASVKTAGAAGVSAAGTVVGNLVSDLMPRFKGRWAKIKEIMKRLGRRMGVITGVSVAASTAIAMVGGEAAGSGVAGLAAALGSKARKFKSIFRGWGRKMGKFAGRGLVLGIIAGIAIAGPQIVKALMKIRDDAWEAVTGKKRSGFDKAVEGQPGFDQGKPFPLNLFEARGGVIPGRGTGDKVPVLAEPGEGFLNLKAMRALGGQKALDRLNAMFPRFAKGGEVGAAKATRAATGKPGKGAELTAQLTYSSALATERKAGGKVLRGMEVDLGKLASTAEVKSGDTADALRKHIRSGGKDGSRFLELYRKQGGDDLDGLRKSGGKSSADLGKEIRKHTNDAQKAGSKSFEALRREGSRDTSILERAVEKGHREIESTVDHRTNSARQKGEKAFDRLRKGASNSVGQLTEAVFTGLSYIDDATNKALKAFEVKPVKLSVPKPKKLKEGGEAGKGFATGGMVVPGTGSGDKVPLRAMVEPGEGVFVVNRNAMGALDEVNRAVPRFAGGGGLQPGISALAKVMSSRFGMQTTSGVRPGDPGFHGQGLAADVSGGRWEAAARYANSIGSQLLEGIYNGAMGGPKVSWDSGKQVSPGFWGGATWGAHGDHIHLAIKNFNDQGMAQDVPKIEVKGTEGPLRELAQSAIDMMRKGANTYIAEKAPSSSMSGQFAGKGQFNAASMAKLWIAAGGSKRLAHIMGAIGMAESGGVAGVTGGGTGGDDGRGLWQIEWPVWASQFKGMDPTNPEDNAKMAIAVHKAQGLSAWVVYQTGAYRKYMQEGGELPFAGSFAKGGIVPGPRGMPQSAIVHGGERIGSAPPAVNITFADGMGWLADFIQVEIEDAAPGIAEYTIREGGRGVSRSQQLAGQAGRN